MTDTQKSSFRRIWKKFIGWTSMLLVAALGVVIFTANWQLNATQQHAAATEATLADREAQIAILRNALNRTTSDLSSRESLIARSICWSAS